VVFNDDFILAFLLIPEVNNVNKKPSNRRGTACSAMSAEMLSTPVQLYKKQHLGRLAIGE